jgi:hypothetical protein
MLDRQLDEGGGGLQFPTFVPVLGYSAAAVTLAIATGNSPCAFHPQAYSRPIDAVTAMLWQAPAATCTHTSSNTQQWVTNSSACVRSLT